MDKLLDDLFHAQPDALFMIVGLFFLAIAVVGSVKTYINPGKFGRIAAGALGVILVVVGFLLYRPAPAAETAGPVAQQAPGPQEHPQEAGPLSTFCRFYQGPKAGTIHNFAGKGRPMRVGAVCRDGMGSEGLVVAPPAGEIPAPTAAATEAQAGENGATSTLCRFTSGPKSGTTQNFPRMRPLQVGSACHDGAGSRGVVVAPE